MGELIVAFIGEIAFALFFSVLGGLFKLAQNPSKFGVDHPVAVAAGVGAIVGYITATIGVSLLSSPMIGIETSWYLVLCILGMPGLLGGLIGGMVGKNVFGPRKFGSAVGGAAGGIVSVICLVLLAAGFGD